GAFVTSASGYKWLRLSEGPYKDHYVWERNLADAPPPEPSSVIESGMTLRQDAEIHRAPDADSEILGTAKAGSAIYAAVKIGKDWVEIHNIKGGVGYVLVSAF